MSCATVTSWSPGPEPDLTGATNTNGQVYNSTPCFAKNQLNSMCKVKSGCNNNSQQSKESNNTVNSKSSNNNNNNNSNNGQVTNNNNNHYNSNSYNSNYHHYYQHSINNRKHCSNQSRFLGYTGYPGSYFGRPNTLATTCPLISYSPSMIYVPINATPISYHHPSAALSMAPLSATSPHASYPPLTVATAVQTASSPMGQQHVTATASSPPPSQSQTQPQLMNMSPTCLAQQQQQHVQSPPTSHHLIGPNQPLHFANSDIKLINRSNDLLASYLGKNNEALQFLSKGAQVIVRMRGLPYDCTDQKVIEFFSSGKNSCEVMDGTEGVLFVRRGDGRPTGDAFVLFESEEMASKALQKHRESIGSRYIELFRSSTAEVQQVLNRAMDYRSSCETNGPISLPQIPLIPQQLLPSGSRRDCIRLRGLPYEAQVEQILEFLGEHAKNIVFRGVHMVYNAQGQPSGEAFIQMDSEHSASLAAAQRHHKYMSFGKKQRYIEVFQCSIDDMNLVLTGGVPMQRHLQTPGTILPTPYRAYPYLGGAQVLPAGTITAATAAAAAAALSTGAAGVHPTSYYHPIIYWPYPSPPVSPTTYYTHSGPTMITSDCLQIPRNSGVEGRTNGGEGLITFPPRLEAERAIQEKNRTNIGSRCIELYLA